MKANLRLGWIGKSGKGGGRFPTYTRVIQTTRRKMMMIFLEALAYGAMGAIVVLILQEAWSE